MYIFTQEMTEPILVLAEYLGIPLIILLPLLAILYIIFKWVLPRILNNNSRMVGRIVISIIAQLFGEPGGDSIVEGVDELEVAKVIKDLPNVVNESLKDVDANLIATIELIVLLSQAMMDERYIKPHNDTKLQEISKKGNKLLNTIQIEKDKAAAKELLQDGEVDEDITETV